MSEDDPRKKAREFVTFIQSLSESERVVGNEKERQRALDQHARFQTSFREGRCFLCHKPLKSFEGESPCIHWLLRPPGFTKWHFAEVAQRYGYFRIEAFLRWVASEEAFAKNINDLRDEGSGKLIEMTIRYKAYEWSFSCGENDYLGHSTSSEESKRPHYHFQMRVNGQAFIRYNDFHVPFSYDDILMIEAQRIAPETVGQKYSTAPGMSALLQEDKLEELVMKGASGGREEDADLELNTFIMADEGTKISGSALVDLFEEAKRRRVTVSSLARSLPNVRSDHRLAWPGGRRADTAIRPEKKEEDVMVVAHRDASPDSSAGRSSAVMLTKKRCASLGSSYND
jgi:hypothetical protein